MPWLFRFTAQAIYIHIVQVYLGDQHDVTHNNRSIWRLAKRWKRWINTRLNACSSQDWRTRDEAEVDLWRLINDSSGMLKMESIKMHSLLTASEHDEIHAFVSAHLMSAMMEKLRMRHHHSSAGCSRAWTAHFTRVSVKIQYIFALRVCACVWRRRRTLRYHGIIGTGIQSKYFAWKLICGSKIVIANM